MNHFHGARPHSVARVDENIVIRLQEIFFVEEKNGWGGKNVEKIFCRMGKKLYLCSRFMSERLEQVSTERTLDDHSAVFS